MIDWINEWVKNIVFVVLLASFVDLLLPNASMQKYARVVLGMLVILIIITPILEVFGDSISISSITKEFESDLTLGNTISTLGSIDSIRQKGEQEYQDNILEQVEVNMKINLKQILEERLNIVINNLILKTEVNSGVWEINQIIIYATINENLNTVKEDSIRMVEAVGIKNVVVNNGDTLVITNEIDEENKKIISDIKEIIEDEWNIKKEKIAVYINSDMK
ncbi:MAG: stage III sporulation protein AF [Vulcanibacillus sp.]